MFMPLSSAKIEQIIRLLKQRYTQFSAIKRVTGGENFLLGEGFINLALIKEDKQREIDVMRGEADVHQKDNTLEFRDERLSSFESLYEPKERLALEKFFIKTNEECEEPKKVVILGRAGIGKSVLCNYIAYKWADNAKWLEGFKAVFLVPRATRSRH